MMERFEYRKFKFSRVLLYLLVMFILASCDNVGGVILSFSDDSDSIKSKEFYEGMLEQFCQKNYNDLYHDFWGTRKYVSNSLTVDSIRPCGEREITVYGKHDFIGRFGKLREGYKYEANVYESKKGSNDYIITFEKQSKKIITKKSYKESRTKAFHYEK